MSRNRSAPTDREDLLRSPVYAAYQHYEGALKRFIGRFVGAATDVDDIVQEAFLRAFATERKRPIEQPKSFLFRIAKHLALTRLARKQWEIEAYIEELDNPQWVPMASSAEDEVSGLQILGLMCEAIAELSPQCRKVYLLRKRHSLSHREISTQLGIAVSTVEKHLMKAVEHCDRYVARKLGVLQTESASRNARSRKRSD